MSKQYFFRINGVSSNESVELLEQILKIEKGVESAEIDLETSMASVKASIPAENIVTIIMQAGYNAVLLSD